MSLLPTIEATCFAGLPLAHQGLDLDAVLLRLGLLHEPFYDMIHGASPAEVAALESASGLAVPPAWRAFLERLGGSTGPLRIVDWRTTWDFRPATLVKALAARTPGDRAALRKEGLLPVAHLGPTLEEGYHHDVALLLEVGTGWLYTDDSCRDAVIYDAPETLLLEWGHRLLDPLMAKPAGRAYAHFPRAVPPGRVEALHALVRAAHAPQRTDEADCVAGGLLGVYRFHDSGLLVKTGSLGYPRAAGAMVWLEARCARRVEPERCAAVAVLRQAQAKGLATAG